MSHAQNISPPQNTPLAGRVDALRASELPVVLGNGADEWSPDLQLPHSMWEIFGSMDDVAGDALALAFAQKHCAAGGEGWPVGQRGRRVEVVQRATDPLAIAVVDHTRVRTAPF